MLRINIDHDVIINEIEHEVKMNEMLCATHYLKSDSFAGCYAIVAEFTEGQKLLGMLGHYDPMHIFLFEIEFPFSVRSLEKKIID